MNRDYLTQQLDDVWWAALLHPVQVALIEAAQPRFTSHERGQADQMPWAVGRVAAAQGSAKGAISMQGPDGSGAAL